jgi:transmembrane sensor
VPPTEPIPSSLNLQQVREDAAAWLSRVELGTADEDAFERWRSHHPVHALEFARAFANWEAMRGVSGNDRRRAADPMTRRHLLRIAAAGAALAIGGAFWVSRHRGWTTLVTEVGKTRTVSLPDLSELELNTSTEVSWKFAQNRSVIQLVRGEISVALRPGVNALFLGTGLVATLLSGQYNARYLNSLLRLTVINGAALINDPAKPPTNPVDEAVAGQTVSVAKGQSLKIATEPDMESATAWRKGEIVFHDQPLVAAIAEYNRYLTKKIVIEAPHAEIQPVGGRFTTAQPQAFLRAVSLSLDLQLTETADHYWLRPKT